METIGITQSGWKAKVCFVGKAKDWIIGNEHKKRATSVAAEITQEKLTAKDNISNYNTRIFAKEVDLI